jgi:hypothetical protein
MSGLTTARFSESTYGRYFNMDYLNGKRAMVKCDPYQTRFDLVGKSRFHHFNDGGSLIITVPGHAARNWSASLNAAILGKNWPPINMFRG